MVVIIDVYDQNICKDDHIYKQEYKLRWKHLHTTNCQTVFQWQEKIRAI